MKRALDRGANAASSRLTEIQMSNRRMDAPGWPDVWIANKPEVIRAAFFAMLDPEDTDVLGPVTMALLGNAGNQWTGKLQTGPMARAAILALRKAFAAPAPEGD